MSVKPSIAQELEAIREQDPQGKLRPEAVVAFASDPSTALHRQFEWDDTKASAAYRLWQARQIISVMVRVVGEDKPAYRAYVSLTSDRMAGGGYRSLDVIMRSPSMYAEMLDDAFKDLKRLKEKYGQLQELQLVWRAAKRAESQSKRKRSHKRAA